jgi:hypothetical protein
MHYILHASLCSNTKNYSTLYSRHIEVYQFMKMFLFFMNQEAIAAESKTSRSGLLLMALGITTKFRILIFSHI